MMVMGVTLELAGFASSLSFNRISDAAIDRAKLHISDIIGDAVAAAPEPAGQIAIEFARDQGSVGPASILGTDMTTSPATAAFVNGLLAHALDFDEFEFAGHPSCMLVAAVLGTGEALTASGPELITAYLAGLEIYEALARSYTNPRLRGWHGMSVYGSLASSVAAGRMLGLSADQLVMAIGIAASAASGISMQHGTMTKPFHAGNAAWNGVVAATLAKRGFTADTGIIENPRGFTDCFFGPGTCDYAVMTASLGSPFHIVSPGIGIKAYPCSRPQFRAAEAALTIAGQRRIDPDEVESVEIFVSAYQNERHNVPMPRSGLQGKFSINFVVAAALLDGRLTIDTFQDISLARPGIRALLNKVHVVVDEAISNEISHARNRVEVHWMDGSVLSAQADVPKGHPDNPLSIDEIQAKFVNNVGRCTDADAASQLFSRLMRLDEARDIRFVGETFRNSSVEGKTAG